MGLIDIIKSFKNKISDPYYDIELMDESDEKWDEIIYDRDDLKINDKTSREAYVRGCLEQIAEASREVDALQVEYENVTSLLKDMEEIEALPEEEMDLIKNFANEIISLKDEQKDYLKRTVHMDDAKYRQLEIMEDELKEGLDKLKNTEHYQVLIKKDLKKLENEKQAYYYRRTDLRHIIEDCKSMLVVCTVALAVCVVILLILEYI